MKKTYTLLFAAISIISCSSPQSENSSPQTRPDIDRFALQFRDIHEIAEVRRLTDLGRDTTPFFSPSGKKIYFARLLPTSPEADESDYNRALFAIDYLTGKLFLLEEEPETFNVPVLEPDSLPGIIAENTLFGFRRNDAVYFTTEIRSDKNTQTIYKLVNDSLIQLTYGPERTFLISVSPDGRYLVFLYGDEYFRIVIIDNRTGLYYEIPKGDTEVDRVDFSAEFSPDGKYIVFIRSGELYRKKIAPCGDLWLIEFKTEAND